MVPFSRREAHFNDDEICNEACRCGRSLWLRSVTLPRTNSDSEPGSIRTFKFQFRKVNALRSRRSGFVFCCGYPAATTHSRTTQEQTTFTNPILCALSPGFL